FRQLAAELALEDGDLAGRAKDLEPAIDDGEARRVVAAVLEPLQSLEYDRRRCPRAGVAYDAAHNRRPSAINCSATAPDGASAISRMIGSVPDGRTCNQRSGHARRSPSCVSAVASGNRERNAGYTSRTNRSTFRVPRSTFALTIV